MIQNTIQSINDWHALARPNPTPEQFNVQLGVHFEEIAEMLDCIKSNDPLLEHRLQTLYSHLTIVANDLKLEGKQVEIVNRGGFTDSIADQIVTGVGTAYCAGINAPLALNRVDTSNWSKFVDGKPVFKDKGKIAKGPNYVEPDLTGCY